MTPQEISQEVAKLLDMCIRSGKCQKKAQFCEIAQIQPQNLASILRGDPRYATENMLMRARINVEKITDMPAQAPACESDIIKVTKMFTEQLAAQRESYERIIMALGGKK